MISFPVWLEYIILLFWLRLSFVFEELLFAWLVGAFCLAGMFLYSCGFYVIVSPLLFYLRELTIFFCFQDAENKNKFQSFFIWYVVRRVMDSFHLVLCLFSFCWSASQINNNYTNFKIRIWEYLAEHQYIGLLGIWIRQAYSFFQIPWKFKWDFFPQSPVNFF